MRNLTGHTGAVYTIDYLSDGTIVSGAGDSNAIIWNPTTGTQLVSFNPLSYAIYVIKEISSQVIAVGGYVAKVNIYRVNGTATPTLIKSISASATYGYFGMIVDTLLYNGYNSSILYVGCAASYALAINITNLATITLLQTIKIDSSSSSLYQVEKSSKEPIF